MRRALSQLSLIARPLQQISQRSRKINILCCSPRPASFVHSMPSYSQTHGVLSSAHSQKTIEYVEDSEPEREQRRLQKKKIAHAQKKTRVKVSSPEPVAEVIEISDSGPSQPRPPVPETTAHVYSPSSSVIVLSGKSGG